MRWTRAVVFSIVLLASSCCAPEPVETAWMVEACASSTHWDYNEGQITIEALQRIAGMDDGYRTVLFNHDTDRPIGRILSLWCSDGKLRARIESSKSASDIWQLIQEEVLTGISVGIYVRDFTFDHLLDEERDVRVITSADLIEISIVSLPANPDARIEKWYVIE